MNPIKHDDLERELTELTTWRGEDAGLWKKALEAPADSATTGRDLNRALFTRLPQRLMAACAVLFIGVLLVGIFMPALGKARQSSRQIKDSTQIRGLHQGMVSYADRAAPQALAGVESKATHEGAYVFGLYAVPAEPSPTAAPVGKPFADDRFVIRKSNIDVQTDDVRSAFAKATHLVSEAGGEYVENSSLTGEGKSTQANLTLRIGAARLSEVMNKLRELGTVKSESSSGEDVTTQVVDLEARIRNEQRIEKELLDLLERRKDSPLKDLLELRSSLSNVRQTIEQLIGQRERMGRLVSLASILVVIRAEPQVEPPPKPAEVQTIGMYFKQNIADSWRSSLRYLVDCLSNILGLLVGGLMWWMAAAVCVAAIMKWRRRLSARCV